MKKRMEQAKKKSKEKQNRDNATEKEARIGAEPMNNLNPKVKNNFQCGYLPELSFTLWISAVGCIGIAGELRF